MTYSTYRDFLKGKKVLFFLDFKPFFWVLRIFLWYTETVSTVYTSGDRGIQKR